jgi:hypothetical protein
VGWWRRIGAAPPDLRLNVMSGFRDPANDPKQKTVLEERSDATPAVAWHNGRLFIAWKGVVRLFQAGPEQKTPP